MPKQKKKNQKNDFYFFMQDQKNVLRTENVKWDTMDDLVARCQPRWNLLSDKDKARYKEMAKQHKESSKENLMLKQDSKGRDLLSVEMNVRDIEQQHSAMINQIMETLETAHQVGSLPRQRCFLIHINVMCKIDDRKYLPCEIAILEFSLEEGIVETFHSFIRPPKHVVPLGYGYVMQKQADETHRVTMDEDPMISSEASSYDIIVDHIVKRINPGGLQKPICPIYTHAEDTEMASSVLEDIFNWAGQSLHHDFKVYECHQLLFLLSKYVSSPIKSHLLAQDELNSDKYNYALGLGCSYHDWFDRPQFCSLNYVKRWAYIIMDKCCSAFDIEPLMDVHYHIETRHTIKEPRHFKQTVLVKWSPDDEEDVPQQSDKPDMTLYGAPKTRAAPAGFIHLNPKDVTSNPKRMGAATAGGGRSNALNNYKSLEQSLPSNTVCQHTDKGQSPNATSVWMTQNSVPLLSFAVKEEWKKDFPGLSKK